MSQEEHELKEIEILEDNNENLDNFLIENEKDIIYNNLIINSEKKFRISKFEKAKIIGIRATQLASGINTLLDNNDLKKINIKNTLDVAESEFKKGLIPIIIKRKYPNEGKDKYIQFSSDNFENLETI